MWWVCLRNVSDWDTPGRVGGARRVREATRVDAQVLPRQVNASGPGADGVRNPVGDGASRLLGGTAGERHHILREFNGDHDNHGRTAVNGGGH